MLRVTPFMVCSYFNYHLFNIVCERAYNHRIYQKN